MRRAGRPFFGICVGMQLMATRGLEYEETPGLGWIAGDVAPIRPRRSGAEDPAHGLEHARADREHPLFAGIPLGTAGLHAYFVHSYALRPANDADVVARTDHGGPVTAMVGRDNLAGTSSIPRRARRLGLALLANFLRWRP